MGDLWGICLGMDNNITVTNDNNANLDLDQDFVRALELKAFENAQSLLASGMNLNSIAKALYDNESLCLTCAEVAEVLLHALGLPKALTKVFVTYDDEITIRCEIVAVWDVE